MKSKENMYLATTVLSLILIMMFLPFINLVIIKYKEQWIGIPFGEMSIYPSIRLTGVYSPEYPKIGELVHFKAQIESDIRGKNFSCENCSINIESVTDKITSLKIENISLNKSGEIEFYYETNPTWIDVEYNYNSNIVKLKYRIPKPDTKEALMIAWEDSWVWKFAIILSTIGGLGFIINILIFFCKRLKRYLIKDYKKKFIIAE